MKPGWHYPYYLFLFDQSPSLYVTTLPSLPLPLPVHGPTWALIPIQATLLRDLFLTLFGLSYPTLGYPAWVPSYQTWTSKSHAEPLSQMNILLTLFELWHSTLGCLHMHTLSLLECFSHFAGTLSIHTRPCLHVESYLLGPLNVWRVFKAKLFRKEQRKDERFPFVRKNQEEDACYSFNL